ncbi:2-succinylbenzoate--CoA ligase-like [Episyrphus balteatus]|uniref:2-succinylbenzoate--CoA ligase-like n=1 Tax=Episyrphus balteatus TaxID=286459 RepID=UPI0024865414|nr:2-succinylbenzoate--CoA ligase-like [Episyrphus balteatus]
METIYNEVEKIWSTPGLNIEHRGLGEAILTKLKTDNQDRIFEFFYDKGITLTVADVRQQTIKVAQNLQRIGLKKGDTVVIYSMLNEKITPIAFGCFTIGAPVNYFETNFDGDDINEFLEKIDPVLIVFEEEYRSRLFKAIEDSKLPNLKHILSLDSVSSSVEKVLFQDCGSIDTFEVPKIEDPATHPALLLLTSGTTRLPKIMALSHAVMMEGIYSWWNIEAGMKIFSISPVRWISQASIMLQPVFFDCQRFYTSQNPSGELGRDIIDTYKITHFVTVPANYPPIFKAAEMSGNPKSLSSLKIAAVGGEVVSEAFIDIMSKALPKCRPVKCYGMTEFGGLAATDEDISKKGVNGGALKRGFMAKIVNENQNSLGPNEKGQLFMKRISLPYLKYWKNDKANEENFVEGGWLNTGDFAYMDSDNLLNIVARSKDLVRSGGNIIVPVSIETVIGSHPNVQLCALIGHPNPVDLTDEIGIVFVSLRSETVLHKIEDDLRNLLMLKCTKEEAQVVRHIKVLSEMPLTTCGKINRNVLAEMA